MDKQMFLDELVNLYEDFTEKNITPRLKAYNLVLVGNIDYARLYKKLIQTYKSFSFAPSPAVIFEIVEDFRREKERENYQREMEQKELERQKAKEKEENEKQKAREKSKEEIETIKQIQEQIKNNSWRVIYD